MSQELITHIFKILPVILSLLGVTSSFLLYSFGRKLLAQLKMSLSGKKIYVLDSRMPDAPDLLTDPSLYSDHIYEPGELEKRHS